MARIVFYSVVLASVLATAGVASAQCPGCKTWNRPLTEESQPDVFYNFYVPGNGGSPAAALPAPYPTPPIVGHSYYTYQPLMPNEMLYMHHRTYHQSYNAGMGLNRTKVRWYGTPVRTAAHSLWNSLHWARAPYTAPHNLVMCSGGWPHRH